MVQAFVGAGVGAVGDGVGEGVGESDGTGVGLWCWQLALLWHSCWDAQQVNLDAPWLVTLVMP
jgi:hypothetical protein